MQLIIRDLIYRSPLKDGMNAHRIGKDFKRESVRLNKRDKLKIHLAPGGGFAIRLQ